MGWEERSTVTNWKFEHELHRFVVLQSCLLWATKAFLYKMMGDYYRYVAEGASPVIILESSRKVWLYSIFGSGTIFLE